MQNIITPLNTALESFIDALNVARTAIYAEANARKARLAAAVADMNEAHSTMKDFINITETIADACAEFGNDMSVSEEHVADMMGDVDVYSTPVELFDGICDKCGVEMTRDTMQFIDEDGEGWICANCEKELHPEPAID